MKLMPRTPEKPGGRPKIDIDWDMFDRLCEIFCTQKEIAAIFCCSIDTIENAVKEHANTTFSDYYESKSAGGRSSLRRWQYRKAEEGNPTMLIWMGKQYLGQSDKQTLVIDKSDADELDADILTDAIKKQETRKRERS